jgi:putative thioredoxin
MESTTTPAQLVYTATEADFAQRVVARSNEVPVVVDFWAEWCAPCRALGPAIEKAVTDRGGKVELAKVDTDANQQLMQAFGIQSIPAVKAFRHGKVIDEFVGAIPPAQIEKFIDRLIPSEADELVAAGDEQSLRKALTVDARNTAAAKALARMLLARGETQEALATVGPVEKLDFGATGLAARARMELAGDAPTEAFEAWNADEPERALELLQGEVANTDDSERREALRAVMVGWFDELGPENDLVSAHRRRLAATLN